MIPGPKDFMYWTKVFGMAPEETLLGELGLIKKSQSILVGVVLLKRPR